MSISEKKEQLKSICAYEEKVYFGDKGITSDHRFRKPFKYEMLRYLQIVRRLEFLIAAAEETKNPLIKKKYVFEIKLCDRRKNKLGLLLGVEIPPSRIGKGVRVYHPNVTLNGYAGEDCVFHGNNVLGNKRTGAVNEVPRLGNRVDVGTGAMIIGDVTIADDCVIGAGAVVTKSFTVPGTVIAGVPAKEIGKNK